MRRALAGTGGRGTFVERANFVVKTPAGLADHFEQPVGSRLVPEGPACTGSTLSTALSRASSCR